MDYVKATVRDFESLNLPLHFNVWFAFPYARVHNMAVEDGLLSGERVEWKTLLKVAGIVGNKFSRSRINSILRRVVLRTHYPQYRRAAFRAVRQRLPEVGAQDASP